MEALTLIGIDFGLKNIGLAVGQTLTHTASPLKSVRYSEPFNWTELDKVFKEWRPNKIIMGWPLSEDGNPQSITNHVKKFSEELKNRYQTDIIFMDERYSSMQAQAEFANARAMGLAKRKNAKNMDSYAARNILNRWLDLHS